jgi:hypothetical protein
VHVQATHCARHVVLAYGSVRTAGEQLCSGEACSKRAIFGYPGQDALYCSACIPAKLSCKLIDGDRLRCEHPDCCTAPAFGYARDRVSGSSSDNPMLVLIISSTVVVAVSYGTTIVLVQRCASASSYAAVRFAYCNSLHCSVANFHSVTLARCVLRCACAARLTSAQA